MVKLKKYKYLQHNHRNAGNENADHPDGQVIDGVVTNFSKKGLSGWS
ncbi:MAG: hypothetical protein R3C26_13810 [Calditrichia bacterium]